MAISAGVTAGGHMQTLHDGAGDARCDEHAAEHGAEDDGRDGQAFHPAIGPYQSFRRQVFGEDAVFGGRVGRRAEAGQAVCEQRVDADQHGDAARHLDRVADEHHAALGQRVGKSADERREHDERQDERLLQNGRVPARRVHLFQQGDGGKQQCVVGERGEKLRCEDGVEAAIHYRFYRWKDGVL